MLVATREIAAGEELLWRYGVSMRKHARAGEGDGDEARVVAYVYMLSGPGQLWRQLFTPRVGAQPVSDTA